MVKKIVIFSLLCFLMGGCIKEDRDDCGRFRLHFRYTHNQAGQDLLAEQVRDIRVYVFDQDSGSLSDVIVPLPEDIDRGYLDIELPDGLYTLVAWGGGSDLMQNGYTAQAALGNATLENFRLMLVSNYVPGNKGGTDVTPRHPAFEHLFFAAAEGIEAVRGKDQNVDLNFIKNTSTLKVIVSGLENMAGTSQNLPLDIFVTGRNYLYGSDNGHYSSTPRMLYQPYESAAGEGTQETWIRQQRLSVHHSIAEPVMLHVRHAEQDFDMIVPLSLVDAILQNPAYPNQDAIDREDLFVVELSILLNLKVSISINGWEVVILDPDISGRNR